MGERLLQKRNIVWATNLTIISLWLWLYRSVFDHLSVVFSREDFRTNQLMLLGIVLLIVMRMRKERAHLRFSALPHWNPFAGLLLAGGTAAYLAVERWLDINIIATCLFGLASYGLLGLWLQPTVWRQGFVAALLLIGVLPFGDFMQVFIGYPMRLLTAALVRDGLAALGVTSLGVETILMFENGVAQVDLPCSGVKSLWTGALFLLAATWVERRSLNAWWFALALTFALLLFCANLARVATLVVVGQVLGLPLLAALLHVPLGVIAFVLVCIVGVGTLRRGVPLVQIDEAVGLAQRPSWQPSWLALMLVVALVAGNWLYAPRPTLASAAAPTIQFRFPAALHTQPLRLRPGELDWLVRDGAEAVERVRFEWRGLTGSMLLVQSRAWRAHHQPERCFEGFGFRIAQTQTMLVGEALPLRWVTLDNGKANGQLSAFYWFQSVERTTDDYGSRLWSALSLAPERWMLVTALFDERVSMESVHGDVADLQWALQAAVRAHLASLVD